MWGGEGKEPKKRCIANIDGTAETNWSPAVRRKVRCELKERLTFDATAEARMLEIDIEAMTDA